MNRSKTPAIRVEKLKKRYVLGEDSQRGFSLRNPFSKKAAAPREELWALDGLEFEIYPGEVVGIIGRNGAGKSTLLKILSRITAPTEGRVEIHGAMASLLEVGTGFHPELTGRENVFLNGALLGMSKDTIESKFDEIVAFAEIERFIDTPVKRYSSGMYVRLAFAIAAHLEPEILLVDEILAVGDGAFQKKCLGRLKDTGGGDRTVLFVSHNLPTVRSLCSRVLMIQNGRIVQDGSPDEVLSNYNRALQVPRDISNEGMKNRIQKTTGAVRVKTVAVLDEQGTNRWTVRQGDEVRLRIDYEIREPIPSMGIYLTLISQLSGETVTTIKEVVFATPQAVASQRSFEIVLPQLPLRPGDYILSLTVGDALCGKWFDIVDKHQDLPWLSVTSNERDLQKTLGYVTIPARVDAA